MSEKGFFASICNFFCGLFSSKSDEGQTSATVAPAAKNNDGLTGVERYIRKHASAQTLTGVEKYIRKQASAKPMTGVEAYIQKQASAKPLTGVEKYIRSHA
jgi:hypothetical protein